MTIIKTHVCVCVCELNVEWWQYIVNVEMCGYGGKGDRVEQLQGWR